jgi:hypothetical protein
VLPAFRAQPDIALGEFPNDQLLVRQDRRSSMQLLPHQGGRAAVVDERRQRLLQLPCEMRDQTG